MLSRMKFDLDDLVTEILDRLPESVWASSSTTFLDPAFGGGQFVRNIESRLKAHGHTEENIKERVYGFEESELHVRFAVNKYKLVGQYKKLKYEDFVKLNSRKKFDVIVGNPQSQSEKGTGTQPLWPLFVSKSHQLLTDTGYLAMITPNKWCGHSTNVIKNQIRLYKDLFKEHLVFANVQECSRHFSVGGYKDSFSYFVVGGNAVKVKESVIQNLEGTQTIDTDYFEYLPMISLNRVTSEILKKIKTSESYNFRQISTGFENRNNGSIVISMAHRLHYSKLKVYLDKNTTVKATSKSTVSKKIYAKSSQEKIDSVFKSKLYQFLHTIYWNNDNFSTTFYSMLPYLNPEKLWTDEKIYAHFGLSTEEIEHIETTLDKS